MLRRRKTFYEISPALRKALRLFGRLVEIPAIYDDLLRFTNAVPYEDPQGKETLWLTVSYDNQTMKQLRPKLTFIYAMLKIGGDVSLIEHLQVERIDFGEFGNSRPFRVRITNQFNGNSDYYYVKNADASRIYGLELEHLLSPNRISYMVKDNTLIEEHIAGVPGDVFLRDHLPQPDLNRVRIAKEFTKFSERCFIRLLGDMRSVNYVVDITPDFEEVQYRVRPIDFDQQTYEGDKDVYQSFRYASNRDIVRLAFKNLNRRTIQQYVEEERSQMARRAKSEIRRLTSLFSVMRTEDIAPEENFIALRDTLGETHGTSVFKNAMTMGDLTAIHIRLTLDRDNL